MKGASEWVVEPPLRVSHPIAVEAGMKVRAGMSTKYLVLLEEYRMALSLWSETRAFYAPEALEVAVATRHLEELERELSLCVPLTTGHASESSNAIGLLPPAA
jgi:hypothetical protein